MITHPISISSLKETKVKTGAGLINKLINNLPFELHLPGYNYCGPGTKLYKRLSRNDKGINPLDEACKLHDIAYAQNTSIDSRHKADLQLAAAAKQRWHHSPHLSERLAGLAVDKIMKFKVKRGMGMSLKKLISESRKVVKNHTRGKKRNGGGKSLIIIHFLRLL